MLELTLIGGGYRADGAMALCAGRCAHGGPDRRSELLRAVIRAPASFSLAEGERLNLGRTTTGARTYLAVSGGWQTKLLLGSRSTEKPLRSGDVIPAAPGTIVSRRFREPHWISPADEPFRIIVGPDGRSHSGWIKHSGRSADFEWGRRVTGWACGSRVIR